MIFKAQEVSIHDITEAAKLRAWSWISAKVTGFKYSLAMWIVNHAACLQLRC